MTALKNCPECVTPCPEHNVTYCATCHKHPGECSFGDCEENSLQSFNYGREIRAFCLEHATSPDYAFVRVGGKPIGN